MVILKWARPWPGRAGHDFCGPGSGRAHLFVDPSASLLVCWFYSLKTNCYLLSRKTVSQHTCMRTESRLICMISVSVKLAKPEHCIILFRSHASITCLDKASENFYFCCPGLPIDLGRACNRPSCAFYLYLTINCEKPSVEFLVSTFECNAWHVQRNAIVHTEVFKVICRPQSAAV